MTTASSDSGRSCPAISIDAGASSCCSSSSNCRLCLLSPASLDLPLIVCDARHGHTAIITASQNAARRQLGATLRLQFWLRWFVVANVLRLLRVPASAVGGAGQMRYYARHCKEALFAILNLLFACAP